MAYTRTFSDNYRFPVYDVVTSSAGGRTVRANSVTSRTAVGTRTGEKMPDYKQKIRDGQNAATPYYSDRVLLKGTPGSARASGAQISDPAPGVPRVVVSETFAGFNSPPPASIAHKPTSTLKAEAIALSKVLKKIKEEQQHMNSPAVLAEFVDVLRQLGSPMRSIVDLTNRHLNRLELERRRLSGSVAFKRIKWHEIVASTYLEWSFGLSPLISDTKSAAEALARWQWEATGESRMRSKAIGRGIDQVVSHSSNLAVLGPSQYLVGKTTTRYETECRVQYTVGLSTTPLADFGSNDRLLQLLGFNHANWIPAIWEAVPWSWLVDYFTNIQQILDAAATVTTGVTWISKAVTYRTSYKTSCVVDPAATRNRLKSFGYNGSGSGSGGDSETFRTTVTRTIPASLGVPPLYFELPSDVKQVANMAAVLIARKPSSSALWLF